MEKKLLTARKSIKASLTRIQKFYYLKSSLKGDALKTIEAFATTEENYDVALQLLVERYNNKNYLMNAHFKALFEIPTVGRKVAGDLRKLIVESKQHLRSLETLGLPVPHWDAIVIYIIIQKLDSGTRTEWELSKVDDSIPSLHQLYQFLEKRCFSLEAAGQPIATNEKKWQGHKQDKAKLAYVTSEAGQVKEECGLCQGQHDLCNCDTFKRQEVKERYNTVKSLRVCFNCLRGGHMATRCKAGRCKQCKRNHHTLLHLEAAAVMSSTDNSAAHQKPSTSTKEQVSFHNMQSESSQVLLSTAVILITDRKGNKHECRVLLDSASQSNFIRTKFMKRLGCMTFNRSVPIKGLNGVRVDITEGAVLEIASRLQGYNRKLEFLVIDNITKTLPVERVDYASLKLPGVQLADPNFGEPTQIDGLLGAEVFLELLTEGSITLGMGLPIMQNTVLGWIVAGRVNIAQNTNKPMTCCLSTADVSEQIARFWDIEEFTSEHKMLTKEEKECEEHFIQNTQRDETGRYIVRLPFKGNKDQLGRSFDMALKRFNGLERKLSRNEPLKLQYTEFMREYQMLGHMEHSDKTEKSYFLPHHAVVKEASLTTKLRVVFDASAQTDTGISLNDTLMIGTTLQDDLFAITIRFRSHNVVFTADIEKMYRQIRMNEEDSDYQKILWRENMDDDIQIFNLKTVTYGTSAAPYLATRCLRQLANDEETGRNAAAAAIINDFYMDDLLTGTSTLDEAIELRDGIIAILTKGGLRLRKWLSNKEELLKTMPNHAEDPLLLLDMEKTTKTLGIMWNAKEDTIEYAVRNIESIAVTKRQVLSQIAQLFDPIGLLGPVIVKAKLVMQRLWMINADWDEQLSEDMIEMWTNYRRELAVLSNIRISRHVVKPFSMQIQMHGFCDASEQAYGACIYLRSTPKVGMSSMSLVCSKSRVAPLKRISLPRLELCAAVLLSRLHQKVKAALKLELSKIILWSDSTIALHWINTPPSSLKTFVGNRVAQIQEATSGCEWRHIRSQQNPADVVSRGLNPGELTECELWWRGPTWILHSEEDWPDNLMSIDMAKLPKDMLEEKTTGNVSYLVTNCDDLFGKYSSLIKLQRVISYCYRFIKNTRHVQADRISGPLEVRELQHALQVLIKRVQEEGFNKEIHAIRNNMAISKGSKLIQLKPFLDVNGILRVGGRLENASIAYDSKHQVILPNKHLFTDLVIDHYHRRLLHGGTQEMLANIRQVYWPINARNNVKRIVRKCIKCLRLRAIETQQIMGDLPSVRVQPSRPFRNSGVDYGGPLLIKRTRNTTSKVYIALFICMSTKAIHLELVSSLSTEDFMGALRRFIGRRGHCTHLYSDNGTNFQGASKELNEMREFLKRQTNQESIQTAAAVEGIQWHFIPPGSPHMGGLWEAGIKSVKHHLKRVVGESKLTYEEMNTLLIQIEAIVNSRPLTPIHDEPNNISVLTPAHFLIGEPLTTLAEPDLLDLPQNRLSRWKLVQQQTQHFWKRWHLEYLHTLQQRTKWYLEKENVKKGMVILLKDNNVPPLQWRLGQILDIHPGKDGKIRVVTIKMSGDQILKRAIGKIVILPIDVETDVVKGAGMLDIGNEDEDGQKN